MILLVEFTGPFVEFTGPYDPRYILLNSVTNEYTDEYGSIKELLTYYKGKYRCGKLYTDIELHPLWKEAKYDVSDIDLTNVTEALSAIYAKYPELLL
jgi:hypothetical protein